MKKQPRITAGAIEDLEPAEIIQMISLGCKTARLTINVVDGEGAMWFEKGRAVHATTEGLCGPDAFYKILKWRSGRFFIEHGITCKQRTIDEDTMLLLMEALRRRDESDSRIAHQPRGSGESFDRGNVGRTKQSRRGLPIALAAGLAISAVLVGVTVDVLHHGIPSGEIESRAPDLQSASDWDVDLCLAGLLAEPPSDERATASADHDESNDPPQHRSSTEPGGLSVENASLPSTDRLASSVATENSSEQALPGEEKTAAEAPAEDPVPDVIRQTGYLHVHTRSVVKRGTLVLLLKGDEILRKELLADSQGIVGWFKKATELNFEDRIEVPSGSYELVARLSRPGKADRESTISLDIAPGDIDVLQLTLGRSVKNRIAWTRADESMEMSSQSGDRPTEDPEPGGAGISSTGLAIH